MATKASEKRRHKPIEHQEEALEGSSNRIHGGDVFSISNGSYSRWNIPKLDSAHETLTDEGFDGNGIEEPSSSTLDTSQLDETPFSKYKPLLVNKKELRLQKNREAARQCRRKKKAYIRCLEERVAALEKQNNELLIELQYVKSLI